MTTNLGEDGDNNNNNNNNNHEPPSSLPRTKHGKKSTPSLSSCKDEPVISVRSMNGRMVGRTKSNREERSVRSMGNSTGLNSIDAGTTTGTTIGTADSSSTRAMPRRLVKRTASTRETRSTATTSKKTTTVTAKTHKKLEDPPANRTLERQATNRPMRSDPLTVYTPHHPLVKSPSKSPTKSAVSHDHAPSTPATPGTTSSSLSSSPKGHGLTPTAAASGGGGDVILDKPKRLPTKVLRRYSYGGVLSMPSPRTPKREKESIYPTTTRHRRDIDRCDNNNKSFSPMKQQQRQRSASALPRTFSSSSLTAHGGGGGGGGYYHHQQQHRQNSTGTLITSTNGNDIGLFLRSPPKRRSSLKSVSSFGNDNPSSSSRLGLRAMGESMRSMAVTISHVTKQSSSSSSSYHQRQQQQQQQGQKRCSSVVRFADCLVTLEILKPYMSDNDKSQTYWSSREIKRIHKRCQRLADDAAWKKDRHVLTCIHYLYGFPPDPLLARSSVTNSSSSAELYGGLTHHRALQYFYQQRVMEVMDSGNWGKDNNITHQTKASSCNKLSSSHKQKEGSYSNVVEGTVVAVGTKTTLRGLELQISSGAIEDYRMQCIQGVLTTQSEMMNNFDEKHHNNNNNNNNNNHNHNHTTKEQRQLEKALCKESTKHSARFCKFAQYMAQADAAIVGNGSNRNSNQRQGVDDKNHHNKREEDYSGSTHIGGRGGGGGGGKKRLGKTSTQSLVAQTQQKEAYMVMALNSEPSDEGTTNSDAEEDLLLMEMRLNF